MTISLPCTSYLYYLIQILLSSQLSCQSWPSRRTHHIPCLPPSALYDSNLESSRKRSFMPHIVFHLAFVENKIRTCLVDGIIGQMHFHIFLVLLSRPFIFTCCKSTQSLFIHINFQRRYRTQQNVHSQIELIVIYKQRILNVLLHNHLLFTHNIRLFGQIDSSTLTVTAGFYDIILSFFLS